MKTKLLPNYISLGTLAALIFFFCEYIIWFGDPIIYGFSYADGTPIDSFGDIFSSQYVHYLKYNGRVWAHVLCQAFSGILGQTAFAVCNAAMYIVFVLLFARITGRSWKDAAALRLCILTVLFFTDTAYNPNCQIGYIWTSTVTLAFIIEYFRYRTAEAPGVWRCVLLFVLSVLAGNGNEAISIGTGAALIVDFFMHFKVLSRTQIVMIAGFGIGGLFLCLSPGILGRASSNYGNPLWTTYRLLMYSRMLYVMIITLAVMKIRHLICLKEFAKDNIFFITALLSLLIFNYMIGITWLSSRQLFGVELFSAILTLRALKGIELPGWIMTVFLILVMEIYLMKFEYLSTSNEDLEALQEEVEKTQDFVIYKDFNRYTSLVHPSELINDYGMRKYAAYSFHNKKMNFGQFIIDSEYVDFTLYPTVMKDIEKAADHNFAAKGADGLYLVVQDMENPRQFYLQRNYNILGFKKPKEPYQIEFDNKMHLDTDGMRVTYGDFNTPLVENGEIIME